MSIFTLVISCLTTSNLPCFMDQTFQFPMQSYSLQQPTLLPSPVPFTTRCCFCFGSSPSCFLELFLHWFPVAYWAPTNLGSSTFSVLSFCLFILFMGFSKQEWWSALPFPFPSPVDHILSELSTTTHLSLMALHSMAHSFIELDKTNLWSVWSVWLVFCDFCGFHSLCPLIRIRIRGLWKLPDGRDWLMGLVLMSRTMVNKSLVQFPVEGGLCSLPIFWPEAKLWWR